MTQPAASADQKLNCPTATTAPPPSEDLPLDVVEEVEVVADLVPDPALAALHHQRALLEGHGVDRPVRARLAAEASEANLRKGREGGGGGAYTARGYVHGNRRGNANLFPRAVDA